MDYFKSTLFLCLLVTLVSCKTLGGKDSSQQADSLADSRATMAKPGNWILTSIDSAAYEEATAEGLIFFKEMSRVDQKEHSLSLSLANGATKVFEDSIVTHNDTSNVQYEYIGYEDETKLYAIKELRYMDEAYLLVQRQTGKVTKLWNQPDINSSGTLIFCRQPARIMVSEKYPAGYQLWEKDGERVTKVKEELMKDDMVYEAKWKSDHELLLKTLDRQQFMGNHYNATTGFKYYSLKRE